MATKKKSKEEIQQALEDHAVMAACPEHCLRCGGSVQNKEGTDTSVLLSDSYYNELECTKCGWVYTDVYRYSYTLVEYPQGETMDGYEDSSKLDAGTPLGALRQVMASLQSTCSMFTVEDGDIADMLFYQARKVPKEEWPLVLASDKELPQLKEIARVIMEES